MVQLVDRATTGTLTQTTTPTTPAPARHAA
jgi:hypothetical protein